MACCAIAVLVIGMLRACWHRLPGVPDPVEVGFAPVARRAAPGSAAPDAPVRPASAPSLAPAAVALVFVALGTVTYAAMVLALVGAGWAHSTGSGAAWSVRSALLVALALASVIAAARWAQPRRSGPARLGRAAMLWGTGSAWWTLGIVDMHVFGLVEVGGGSLAADVAFHGAGAVLMLAGAALAAMAYRRPRAGQVRSTRLGLVVRHAV